MIKTVYVYLILFATLMMTIGGTVADEKSMAKERAVNSLIKSFGWIIVPLPIFLFFQARVKKQSV